MGNDKTASQHTMKNIFFRDYIFSFLAFFCFAAALHALTPTLPIFLSRLGSNEREIGLLVGTLGISSLVFRFVVGKILLRYSEKHVMIWGTVMFALSFLSLIVFRPFWPFFMARLVQGIAFACMDTSAIAYVIRIIPLAYRTRAINYFLLAPPLASAVATSSGVFIVNEYSFSVLLLVCTGLSICAFLLFWKLKGQKIVEPVENVPPKNRLFFEPKILAPAVLSFLNAFSWGGLTAFFPLYAIQCGVKNPGFFFSAMAVMLITSRIMGGKLFDVYSKEKIITTTILIMIIAVVLIAFSSTLPLFILAGFIWGAGFGLVFPVAMAYSLEYAGSSDGTTVATYQAFMDSGIALGPVIMGIIIPLTGYRIMFFVLAFICLANLCYFQFFLKKRHHHILMTASHL